MNYREFSHILNIVHDAVIVVDRAQTIRIFNRGAEIVFGYSGEEVLGKPLDVLIPSDRRGAHRDHVEDFGRSSVESKLMAERSEVFGLRKNGEQFPAEVSIAKFSSENDDYFVSVLRDVSNRKRSEEMLRASLREKEVLLKEVHHRVKNNLQVISSLLNLQERRIEDPAAITAIQESQQRVRSIALIHELLYQSGDFAQVDLGLYIENLISNLLQSYDALSSIKCDVETHNVVLGLDSAVPCGLIINELISNCVKHAFPARSGSIRVEIAEFGERMFRLTVSDDGVGMPENFDILKSRSLGLRLVSNLARQIDGEVSLISPPGTTVTIEFPKK